MSRYELSRPELGDSDWLREQYVTNGLTALAIAESLGVSKRTVLAHMERHGIERRSGSRPPRVEPNVLRNAYLAGASLSEVGLRYGLTPTGVYALLRRRGVTMRPPGGHGKRKAAAWPQLMEPGWLEHEYVAMGRAMSAIAQDLGCRPGNGASCDQ